MYSNLFHLGNYAIFYAKNSLQIYVNSASVLETSLSLKPSNNHAKIS